VQQTADARGEELSGADLWRVFESEYLSESQPLALVAHRETSADEDGRTATLEADLLHAGVSRKISGQGSGPIDAFVDALRCELGVELRVADYREHALGAGADATAMAYVEVITADGVSLFGVARHRDIVTASLRAVVCAANRSLCRGDRTELRD